jgi:3-oxoacyl-[acyl-carrier protein] reductase
MRLLITGASSGIGLYLFHRLAEYERWGVARRPVSDELKPNMLYNSCDVTQLATVDRVVTEIRAKWNCLDALIHCAGTQGAVGSAMTVDPEEWTRTVRANIEGAYLIIRASFSLLQSSQGRSKVILFSGGASKLRPNFTAYGCAKTALVRFAETLAEEWRELPIDINILAPGAINTAMTREIVALGPQRSGPQEHQRALQQLHSGGDSIEKFIRFGFYYRRSQME